MVVAIYGKKFNKGFEKYVFEIFQKLKEYAVKVLIYKPFYDYLVKETYYQPIVDDHFENYNQLPTSEINFFFSIGGDGTFLETIFFVRDSEIPVIGFNSGRLGFLADISKERISQALDDIFTENYTTEKRNLIQLVSPDNYFDGFNYALNEVTVHKKDSSSMINIHAYLDDKYLNTYWADGLIISTPTGSTAYSLSAGGPIVVPNTNNLIITPIAPHTLTVRPIVISDNNVVSLKIEGRNINYLLSLDSRFEVFDGSLEIKLKRATFSVNILKFKNHNYFSTLRNKLMWGMDKRN
jgi:NAD+ kinase